MPVSFGGPEFRGQHLRGAHGTTPLPRTLTHRSAPVTAAPKSVCNEGAAPGLVANIRQTGTDNQGEFSYINIAWDYRGPGCVTEYVVQTIRCVDLAAA